MKILVLNGSPHQNGNTKALVDAFAKGAEEVGHEVNEINVATMEIAGCLGCEYCHTKGNGTCVQKDDMSQVYEALSEAEAVVLASPVYYFTLTGQLQCAIHRTYAIGIPPNAKKTAMLLSSGSPNVYDAIIRQYHTVCQDYMHLEDKGIVTAHGAQNRSDEKCGEAYRLGRNI